jgi:3-oxoacyl-(acyl-carrier-protein) synthase
MSLRIAGMGWVTPLGRGIDPVWRRLLNGEEAEAKTISDPVDQKTYSAFLVPPDALKDLPPHPRLRRSSAISRFAVAAGLDALEQARSIHPREGSGAAANPKIDMQRVALVFAISNGGVVYTKRFYHDVVESGAQSASPLLFPETVFNAPASHLAAILGITGTSYTVVGDGAVGILALKMAEDLMLKETLDYCLVVAAEEADWLLCDAYRKWRLLKSKPPIEIFRARPHGTILSEGAGAILLAREGLVTIDAIHAGTNFSHQKDATAAIAKILGELATNVPTQIIGSANGTFVDLAEGRAINKTMPNTQIYSAKPALGESVGASAIWQVIVGAQSLLTKSIPPLPNTKPRVGKEVAAQSAIVLSCGLNQQVAGLRLAI